MIGFDKTITLYNQHYDKTAKKASWRKTVISGVSYAGQQRVTTGEGLTSDDGYSVRIPKDAMVSEYLGQSAYAALDDVSVYWTAQNGDVVVLGDGPDAANGITEITKQFTECFTVTAVHTSNLSLPILPHLRLEGR